jgi:hypothetical protein
MGAEQLHNEIPFGWKRMSLLQSFRVSERALKQAEIGKKHGKLLRGE